MKTLNKKPVDIERIKRSILISVVKFNSDMNVSVVSKFCEWLDEMTDAEIISLDPNSTQGRGGTSPNLSRKIALSRTAYDAFQRAGSSNVSHAIV